MSTKSKTRGGPPQSDVFRVLHQLVDGCKDPGRFIELFYWSQEPQLAELIRAFVVLPEDAKHTLHAFLQLAEDNPQSVTTRINPDGGVTLSSPAVTGLSSVADIAARPKSTQMVH
jgi:hypothetical protein